MKKILMIATGGTIASKRTARGLEPVLSSAELLSYVPGVRAFCDVDTLSLMNKDSTEITPGDWLCIADSIERHYSAYDGFVVCHGTDTLAYTAAALSYLIQDSPLPIVVTGAQQPIDLETTDAKLNLSDSFLYAASPEASGVCVVFDGAVIAGTRAKKTHTKSYNAFTSTNYPLLATIRDTRVLQYIRPDCSGGPHFYNALNARVALMKLVPGASPDTLTQLLDANDGVIIESYGTGGLPECFYPALEQGVAAGKTIVMTTQVPNEGSDMTVYHVGKGIKEKLGLLEAYDMTLESALTKLMWILAQTREPATVRALFYKTVLYDILIKE